MLWIILFLLLLFCHPYHSQRMARPCFHKLVLSTTLQSRQLGLFFFFFTLIQVFLNFFWCGIDYTIWLTFRFGVLVSVAWKKLYASLPLLLTLLSPMMGFFTLCICVGVIIGRDSDRRRRVILVSFVSLEKNLSTVLWFLQELKCS